MDGPLCNKCRTPMTASEGVVPVWKCACGREIPNETVKP